MDNLYPPITTEVVSGAVGVGLTVTTKPTTAICAGRRTPFPSTSTVVKTSH